MLRGQLGKSLKGFERSKICQIPSKYSRSIVSAVIAKSHESKENIKKSTTRSINIQFGKDFASKRLSTYSSERILNLISTI